MSLPKTITMDKAGVDPRVIAIGELIGLLVQPTADQVDVFTGWFGEAAGQLAGAQNRVPELLAVIADFLGPPVEDGPVIKARRQDVHAQWFGIPKPPDAAWGNTIFYLVTPPAGATGGVFGLGVLYPLAYADISLQTFLFLPLFDLQPTGDASFVLAGGGCPSLAGLNVTSSTAFEADQVTFSSLEIAGEIFLSGDTPSFQLDFVDLQGPDTQGKASYSSLSALLASPQAFEWMLAVILEGTYWLNTCIGQSSFTIADVLIAAKLLKVDSATNKYELSVDELKGTPEEIAQNVLFAVLDSLADSDSPIVPLLGGGIYVVKEADPAGGSDYGLRLQIEDVAVGGGQKTTSKRPAPELDVQIGKYLAGEEDDNSWVARSLGLTRPFPKPGLAVYLLNKNGTTSFAPRCELISLGFDVKGGDNRPLFHLNGYVLSGVETRLYLAENHGVRVYGFGGSFDGLGVPLGPGFGESAQETDNKVAQSLLSSGSEGGKSGDQDPVNPSFGFSGAWIQGGKGGADGFVAQLYDRDGKPTDKIWIPMQRAFGPLQCEKIGIGWVDATGMLTLLFDGGVKVSALEVDLVDLTIGVPIGSPGDFSKYELDLAGLDVTLKTSSVELLAAFVKLGPDPQAVPPREWTEYDGEAVVKVGTFALAAVGSYAYVGTGSDGYASLFIFAVLAAELGDPTATGALFITGLAGGFGFNRALVLPDMDGVATFPLVEAASDPAALGQTPGGPPDPAAALQKLDRFVPPQRGEYWFAGGLRFTSFDLINSTALLSIAFGNELEIALLGTSWISLPPPAAPGASAPTETYAYAELAMEVKLLPAEGVFNASAILTPNSFVIDPACHLTGGFAFCVWFGSNPHAGEWVLTLGGYHPDFTPPSYYPKVPRLGFAWQVSDTVTIDGGAYFALTPSAVMAGGSLEVLFHSGNLRAWFTAHMDALIIWAPFSYHLSMGISVGVYYRLHLLFITKTIKVELGADVTVWGPKMGGEAHVHFYVISFTVAFGAASKGDPPALGWSNADGTGFAQTLLPHKTTAPPSVGAAAATAADAPGTVTPTAPYAIVQNDGVFGSAAQEEGTVWLVRSDTFEWTAITTIPLTRILLAEPSPGPDTEVAATGYTTVGVRPMNTTLDTSVLTITVTKGAGAQVWGFTESFSYSPVTRAVQAAKWGAPLAAGIEPEPNASLPGRLLGISQVRALAPALEPSGVAALDVDMKAGFGYDQVEETPSFTSPHHLPIAPDQSPAGPVPAAGPDSIATIHSTLASAAAQAARAAVFSLLQQLGIDPATNQDPAVFGAAPDRFLDGDPMTVEAWT